MARKEEIRYIQFYTDGSAARQLEPKVQPKKSTPKRPRRQKKIVLHVDFLAVAGILVAGVMLILMMSGVSNLLQTHEDIAELESYVESLEQEQEALRQTYREGYDLEQVRMQALEMGMIPDSRAETQILQIPEVTEASQENGILAFLAGLFA